MAAVNREDCPPDAVCNDHSGHCARIEMLERDVDILFKKIDRMFFAAIGLLGAVAVDVILRVIQLSGVK